MARSQVARYLTSSLLDVTITAPTEGATVSTAAPVIQWAFSPGTQINYRVRIYNDASKTSLAYDSGVTSSATLSHTVTAGGILNGRTYYLIVDITTTTGVPGQSGTRTFITSFSPSKNVTGVSVAPFGAGCGGRGAAPMMLPRARLRWSQVVPGGGETFVRYEIHRRVGGTTTWTRIAVISTITTVTYDDCNIESNEVYEYSVVWVATAAGFTLISAETTPPVQVWLQFEHCWLHDVSNIAYSVRIHSFAVQEAIEQEQQLLRSWGRTAPTVHIGSQQFSTFNIDVSQLRDIDKHSWTKLLDLVTRQRTTGSTLCFRHGRGRVRKFVVITNLTRNLGQKVQDQNLSLSEIQYDETVAI